MKTIEFTSDLQFVPCPGKIGEIRSDGVVIVNNSDTSSGTYKAGDIITGEDPYADAILKCQKAKLVVSDRQRPKIGFKWQLTEVVKLLFVGNPVFLF